MRAWVPRRRPSGPVLALTWSILLSYLPPRIYTRGKSVFDLLHGFAFLLSLDLHFFLSFILSLLSFSLFFSGPKFLQKLHKTPRVILFINKRDKYGT